MTSVNAPQKPSAADSIMASTLLAFSGKNRGADDAIYGGESVSQTNDTNWPYNIALQRAMTEVAKGASINHLVSASVLTQPIDLQVSQLVHMNSSVNQDQANIVALYNCGTYNSPIPFVTPQAVAHAHSSGLEQSADQMLIRQKEIEKALRSKSQRGRKRANLNEVERLELTRTRNREHAKSTRIRKKMRYEELLDYEARIKAIESKEDLDNRRRSCFINFLNYREQMMNELSLANIKPDLHDELMSLFQDVTKSNYDDGNADNENLKAIERMQKFDRLVLSGIVDKASSISYKTKDSPDLHSIAISRCGTALVEVDLIQQFGVHGDKILQSFLFKCTFGSESDKIRSVTMLPVAPILMKSVNSNFEQSLALNDGRQHLEEQISYPSVVSLDVEKDGRRSITDIHEKQSESDDLIGMSF